MDKSVLRKECIANRNSIPADARAERSRLICGEIFSLLKAQFEGRKISVAAYYPLGSEVDIRYLYPEMEKEGWTLCLPVMIKDDGCPPAGAQMRFYELPYSVAYEGRAGFLTKPAAALSADDESISGLRAAGPEELDAVIVPMAGFNGCVRLGYGGGNYDRFLPLLKAGTFITGAAFKEQEHPGIAPEEHDYILPRITVN